MDSGVETGNESNDSTTNQNDNIVAIPSVGISSRQPQCSVNSLIENIPVINSNWMPETTRNIIILPEAIAQHQAMPGTSESMQCIPSNSLVKVSNTMNSDPNFFPLLVFRDSDFNLPVDTPPAIFNSYDANKNLERIYSGKMRSLFSAAHSQRKGRKKVDLLVAVATNNLERAENLLEIGISPNICDEQGRSLLHIAASRGYTDMVKLLLTYGADPNRRDCNRSTPLHLAATTSKMPIVRLLLSAGTDILSLDNHGHSPLQLAQAKLRVLSNCRGASNMDSIKEEVRNVISMIMAYLQKQKDSQEQIEALSAFCSRLSLSNTTDEIQDDVRNLLANIDSLSITN